MDRFRAGLTPCLIRVSGVRQLFVAVEELRAEAYQQARQDHENALMQVNTYHCLLRCVKSYGCAAAMGKSNGRL